MDDTQEKAFLDRILQIAEARDEAALALCARELVAELGDGVAPYLETKINAAHADRHFEAEIAWFVLRNSVAMIVNAQGNTSVQ